ncbi:MAG: RES family NAD+ phosphorylase [Ginsengibacter sp.]|jgi:RES domain-containing protein
MLVYRVGRTKHANDLSGEGAKINGGRWNHKSVPCLYTSSSRALSLLEYTVNVNIEEIPRALSITTIEIPDSEITIINEDSLPGNWKSLPVPPSTQDFGTNLLHGLNKAVFRIPSSVIPEEFNYILNPLHTNSRHFKIKSITDLVYDIRIKLV